MDGRMMSVECEPQCGFMIRSHDEKEMTRFVKEHAKAAHKMQVSDTDVKKMMKHA